MNLDPVDIFGETIGGPLKRCLLFYAAAVTGGWIGECSHLVDIGEWLSIGWEHFSNGFFWPIGVLFSSAAPLLVAVFVTFLLASRWLEWIWCLTAAGVSAIVVHHYEADLGWAAWFMLNAGLTGLVWLHLTSQRARWAKELFELNAENAIRNRMRMEQADADAHEDTEDPLEPDSTGSGHVRPPTSGGVQADS